MANLLIADDHPIFLSGLQSFLEAHQHRVVAHATSAAEANRMLEQYKPDVVMVDFHMEGGCGLEVLEHVRSTGLALPVIFLTVGIDGEDVLDALRLGVNGLVLKNNEPQSLIECIDAVLRGEDWFEDVMIDVLIAHQQRREGSQSGAAKKIDSLSARESEIAQLVARGARNRAIAKQFDIAEGTVKVHLHRIYRKLGIGSRGELMLMILGRSTQA